MTGHNSITEDVEDALQEKDSVGSRLRRYFFTGIIVTAPIFITLWGAWWFLTFVDTMIAGLIPQEYNPNTYLPFAIPGTGLVITAIFLTVTGWFARNFFGRQIIRFSEFIVSRVPLIGMIYNAIKQVLEMTIGTQSTAFRDVVLIPYPHANSWTIGFVTGVTPGEIQSVGQGSEVLNVYIPVTPTTAGFLVFVPKKDVVYLSMSVEDAVKLISSGGIITPPKK